MRKINTDRGLAAHDELLAALMREAEALSKSASTRAAFPIVAPVRNAAMEQSRQVPRPESEVDSPTIPLVRALSQPPMPNRALTTAVVRADVAAEPEDQEFRLPATWYAKPPRAIDRSWLSSPQQTLLIRSAAVACLLIAAGLLISLRTMTQSPTIAPAALSAALPDASVLMSNFAPTTRAGMLIERPNPETPSQDHITTAQILAVSERFVATGDVLAARAMLQDRAGIGEPRALFALAETYDPHLLASWASTNAEPSVTYARFLYEAARRGGVAEAQTRLEALK